MKTITLFSIFIIVSALSTTAQANQKKKILTLFDTEQTIETPKKKQNTKLIKLFDGVPNQPLPEYQSVTLQKYYTKEQNKVKEQKVSEPKATVNNLPFSTPAERTR